MTDYIMTGRTLAARCVDIAQRYKTIYMYACYGFQVTDATIRSKAAQNLNGWYTPANISKLEAVANQSPPVWGFDCVNLIKGVLWGWDGDVSKLHGGAVYASNGIPDTNADGMIKRCRNVSADFSAVEVGEAVWMPGHIGVYIGDGLCVECTPRWTDGVQITAVLNIGRQDGFNARRWEKHGKIPHVDYSDVAEDDETPEYALGSRNLKRGCVGEDVRELQRALQTLGYDIGASGADGEFGKATQKAVIAFQEAHGLEADGVFGPLSLDALKDALAHTHEPEPEQTYSITIRGLSKAEADGLKSVYPNSEVVEE